MSQLTVLSFGGGQDSTAILYMYIKDQVFKHTYAPGDFLVVMSDTGDEHPRTYKHVKEIMALCKDLGIEFAFLKPGQGYHSESWKDLRSFYRRTKTVGSKAFMKSCTDNLKIRPIYKFLDEWIGKRYGYPFGRKKALKAFAENHGKVSVLLGITYEESGRVSGATGPKWMEKSIDRIFPLIEMGMNQSDCQDVIEASGKEIPPPSNCMLCPFMDKRELLWLYRNHPEDYKEWVKIEKAKIKNYSHLDHKKNFGVWGVKLLPEILKEAITEFGNMSTYELEEHKMSHGHLVKSKY